MKFYPKSGKRESGVALVETALALPWVFIIIFGISQLAIYLYTRNVVHYAAFMAARSAVVYEKRTLKDINYPRGDDSKEIAEATAEKIIIESLPWEHKRITIHDVENPVDRSYNDGSGKSGAIQVKIEDAKEKIRARLIYCLPVHFGLAQFFLDPTVFGPCSSVTKPLGSGTYSGITVEQTVELLKNL